MDAFREDWQRAYDMQKGGYLRRLLGCLRSPGVQAVAIFRFGHWLQARPLILRVFLEPVYLIANGAIQVLWGIELPRSARIGAGLYIGHFGGITISPGATIGRRCNLSNNLTIGVSGQGERCGVPTIGNDVYIAPGARVFGRISIGNNVKIGANAVIYKDVPDNAIAVLAPGFRVISLKGNRPTGGVRSDHEPAATDS